MSVGMQRLRDDAARLRAGSRRQGRGPDRRGRWPWRSMRRRRAALGEADGLRAERNAISASRIGAAIKGGADPQGPGGRRPSGQRSTELGARIAALDADLAEVEAALDELLLRIPNPADPDVPVGGEEASVIVRSWGDPRAARRRRGHGAPAALGGGRGPGHARPRGRRQDHRLGLPRLSGRRRGAPARRSSTSFLDVHTREHGMIEIWPPAAGQRGVGARHGADPGQGRPDVRRHARRPVPRAHGGGARHQHPPRRDHRGGPTCPSATSPTRPASGARLARRARTRAASCACTSSTRSRWSASSGRPIPTPRWSG